MKFISLIVAAIFLLNTPCRAQDQQPAVVQLGEGLAIYRPGSVESTVGSSNKYDWLFTDDLTFSVWVRADEQAAVSGDLLSWRDPKSHVGGQLTLKTDSGVTSCQPGFRHLQFGIDDGGPSRWQECGVPGQALFAFSMAVHQGHLYAGTCEPAKGDRGQVYRYAGEQHAGGHQWIACGRLDDANSVTSLAVFQDQLYAGTGRYRVAGSSLPESENQQLGGRVFRYLGNDAWELAGQLPEVEAVGGLVVYRDQLYASSLYKPAGFFRFDGNAWTRLPVPQLRNQQTGELENMRVVPLAVHEDHIYAGSYDVGHVFRYDGASWEDCGQLGQNTQTYGFVRYRGSLLASTWPSGRVYRFNGIGQWDDFGRLGEELEVMGMMVYNGRLMAGTLPSGQVYTLDSGSLDSTLTDTTSLDTASAGSPAKWSLSQTLDPTPNVKYRRAWTMAEYNGRLFCSTLPSGKIFAAEHGTQVSYDFQFPSGWHHVAATRQGQTLKLFIDGKPVGQRQGQLASLERPSPTALVIGDGPSGPFAGELQELKVYRRPLNDQEIQQLSLDRPKSLR